MEKKKPDSSFQRFRNKYRLVVMNDDTFEEVVTFKLSRLSVYVTLSSVFIMLTGLTVALLVLTPLKYYIPGYGKKENTGELQMLKIRTDSLEQAIQYKDQYLNDLKTVLGGRNPTMKDTTVISLPTQETATD
jgi:hypothetical protein